MALGFRKRDKERKPRKTPRIVSLYRATKEADPSITWWMLGVAVLTLVVCVGLAALIDPGTWWLGVLLGLPLAALLAMIVLGRRAEKIMFDNMEGKPGATGAALSMVRRVWTIEETPIDVDARSKDAVFRAYSRKGVALIGEGNPARVKKMLDKQQGRHERILPGVPVHQVIVGNDEGEVPLRKVARHLMKLKGKLTAAEVDVVGKRLRSMGAKGMPIPAGVDPNRVRPDRKAMRGR